MASSKRPGAKKPKRKSKARQTTLNSFAVPQPSATIGQSVSGRRSTRSSGSIVDVPDSPLVPSLAKLPAGAATLPVENPSKKKTKKPKKQQIIKLQKPSAIPAPTSAASSPPLLPLPPLPLSSIHAPRSLDFAVVIYTRSKKSLEQSSQPVQATGSWFQPGVRIDLDQDSQDDVFPILEQRLPLDKGKGKEIVHQGTGNTTDEDTGPVLAPAKKRRGRFVGRPSDDIQGKDSENGSVAGTSGAGRKKPKPPVFTVEGDDSGGGRTAPPATKRVRRSKSDEKLKVRYGHDGGGPIDHPVQVARSKSKKKGKQARPKETEDIRDDPITPVARRSTSKGKGKQVALEKTGDASEPLEHKEADGDENSDQDRQDDLAILSQKRNVLSSRTRYNGSSPKKTPFQKKLAELRAKKAGKTIQEEDSDDDEPQRALYDTDDEDQDSHDDLQIDPGGQSDSDGVSWIIEDGEGTLDMEIPIEFTHLSHQTEQQNFKTFCIWVVQTILNPDFPRDNEISQYAIRALERKMDSYGGSVLQSSIWKAPFMRAMRARPIIKSNICDERSNCDACGKGNRPATHAITFSGDRYDRETLEDLEDSEANDSEDSAGLSIPNENMVFYLGRNCYERALMSHAFIHWKKELRDEIHGLLRDREYFSPFWVNKAAKMDTAERTEWANTVTDDLGDIIRELYSDLKNGLEKAQKNMTNQKTGRWR